MRKIIDTHIHLFDLNKFKYPWLDFFPQLKKNFLISDYFEVTQKFDIKSVIFIETNVEECQAIEEAEYFTKICEKNKIPMGIICYVDIFDDNFYSNIDEILKNQYIKGVRYVLHMDNIAPKTCLKEEFIDKIDYIGKKGLIFEICARMNELNDIYTLVKKCKDTQFVLNHMGNIDPNLFLNNTVDSNLLIKNWELNIKKLSTLENLFCKISGLYINKTVTTEVCEKIIGFCLDTFQQKKLIIGSNYPVSQEFFEINLWYNFLENLLKKYPEEFKENIFYNNSKKLYFNKGIRN